MNRVKEIELRELIYFAFKKWRAIICIGIIVALLAGAYGFISASKGEETVEADDNTVMLKQQLEDLESRLDSQIAYNSESLLMKIDPVNEYVGTFTICVNSSDEAENAESDENNSTEKKIVAAYSAYLSSSEFYNYIIDNISPEQAIGNEIRYVNELMWAKKDDESATIEYSCIGDTEERAGEILRVANQAIEELNAVICDEIADHEYNIIGESVYTKVSSNLEKIQNDSRKQVETYKTYISDKQAELKAAGASSSAKTENPIKSAVKSAIIGGVGAVVLVILYYIVVGMISQKMWSKSSWRGCAIPVVGEIYADEKNKKLNKIDLWIAKILGIAMPADNHEKAIAIVAQSAAASIDKNNSALVAIISLAEENMCSSIVNDMNKAKPDTFSFAGNIISDPEAIEQLSGSNEVIFLAEGEKTTAEEVSKAVELVALWGKKLLGVILIK